MKCIILAAGEGVRMKPLTNEIPKPMLLVAGKPILERIINDLPEGISEVIIVVGYLKDKIIGYFGNKFGGFNIQYVNQNGKLGTYHALELCKDFLNEDEKFLLLYADDLHGAENFKKCSESELCSMLVKETDDPRRFGVVELGRNELIIGVEEKPENPKTNLVSTGVLVLDKNIFNYPAKQHANGEYYLTDSIEQMITAGYKFKAVRSNFWLSIGYPEDIIKAERALVKIKEQK